MQKSGLQSKQAPFCTTFLHETFSLFQHPSNLFETTFFYEYQHRPDFQIHLDAKIKQDLNKKSRQKAKAKCTSRKRKHSLDDKSEKWSVLGK
jgi:hypothetical protein